MPLHTLTVRHRRVRLRQVHARARHALPRGGARTSRSTSGLPGEHDELTGLEYLKGVRLIDQEPIGRTPRSNPVTYVKAFDEIRKLFAAPAAGEGARPRRRRLLLQRAGRPLRDVPGRRLPEARDVLLRGRVRVLPGVRGPALPPRRAAGRRTRARASATCCSMTVDEAVDFFAAQPALARRLSVLQDVGLGYLRLGQPATTLSGGEAQRLKIAAELAARAATNQLYILDEPTTGPAPRRRQEAPRRAQPAGRRRQHRARGRAPPRRHQEPRTGSSTSAPRAARRAARSWPRGRPRRSPRSPLLHGKFLRDGLPEPTEGAAPRLGSLA